MYKDLSLKEKAKVLQYGGKLGLTSVEDIAKLYDDAIGHTFQTKGQMEVTLPGNHPTLNEYLAKRAAEEQKQYFLEGSRNRKESYELKSALNTEDIEHLQNVIQMGDYETDRLINKLSKNAQIPKAEARHYLINHQYPVEWQGEFDYFFNTYNDIEKQQTNAKKALKDNIKYLENCIATATSNHPYPGHFVTGNQTFSANPRKYGFIEVPKEDSKDGSFVQFLNNQEIGRHMAIQDHADKEGNIYLNYGPGDYPSYKINQKDWEPKGKKRFYNFVGNSADSTRWTNEYNQLYGTSYAKGGKLVLDNNGYYTNSKDKDILIQGNSTGTNITMKGIPFKIVAWDNLGNYQELEPNGEYYFPGSMVREHALQEGGNTQKYQNVPEYNIALYNTVSPLGDFPNFWEALAYKRQVKDKLKNGNIYERDYKVGDTQGEKTAMAAWAKRLGIPYDEQDLPVYNGDTVTLPNSLVQEIPYDTNMLKTRIQQNKALQDKYSKYRYNDVVDAAIKADQYNLDKLRETYKTGKPVGQTEFGWNSRQLVDNGEIVPIENIQSPLNVLGNYNVRYSPEERRLYYSDEYDFNQFENFVPGEPYRIRGYIDLDNNKALGGNLFAAGGPKKKLKSPEEILAEKYGVEPVVDNTNFVVSPITIQDKKDATKYKEEQRKTEIQKQQAARTPILKADVISQEDRDKYRNQAEWNRIMDNASEAAANFGYSIGANHPMTVDEVSANTLGALETIGWYTNPALFGALVSSYQLGTGRPGAAALTAGMSVIPETSRLINNTNLVKNLTFANELRKNVNSTILDGPVRFNTPLNSTHTTYINTPRLNLGSLKFFERPSYLTEAEIQGIPRAERNQIVKGKSYQPVREVLKKGNYITKDTDNVVDLSARRFGESEESFQNAKFYQERWLGHKNRTNFEDALSDDLGSTDLIQRYIRQLPDEIDQRFLNDNGLQSFYIQDFRQYLGDLGYETTNLSNEDIAKLLTDQYKMLSAGQTGFLSGDIVFHSGPEFVQEFDFANTGKNTGNMGYLGPGNYFSTEPSFYGQHGNTTMPSFSIGSDYYRSARRQPFLITDIKSMPTSQEIKKLGIIPEYTSPPNSVLKNPVEKQKYIDEFIKPIIDNTKQRDIAVVDDISHYPSRQFTSSPQLEFMVPRNSGIKSLYPHPSLFVENKDGSISLIRNWLDNRVNFSKGGSIHIKPENRGKFTALKKRTGHSASWFKAHGTPAQKKMATFALNAKKWHHKHDEGGYLYSEGGFLLAPYLYNE